MIVGQKNSKALAKAFRKSKLCSYLPTGKHPEAFSSAWTLQMHQQVRKTAVFHLTPTLYLHFILFVFELLSKARWLASCLGKIATKQSRGNDKRKANKMGILPCEPDFGICAGWEWNHCQAVFSSLKVKQTSKGKKCTTPLWSCRISTAFYARPRRYLRSMLILSFDSPAKDLVTKRRL